MKKMSLLFLLMFAGYLTSPHLIFSQENQYPNVIKNNSEKRNRNLGFFVSAPDWPVCVANVGGYYSSFLLKDLLYIYGETFIGFALTKTLETETISGIETYNAKSSTSLPFSTKIMTGYPLFVSEKQAMQFILYQKIKLI